MPKAPPNIPARGDRVVMRKDQKRYGTLTKMDEQTNWVTVQWDDQGGPHMCHLYELEKRPAT